MTEHQASCSCGQSTRVDGRLRAVRVGAFADPAFPPSQVSVCQVRRPPWDSVHDGAEHRD